MFGSALARALHREAPGIRLAFQHSTPAAVENTATMLSTVDGLLLPHGIIDGFPAVDLHQDRWLCMVADDHPDVGDELTLDQLARLPWAVYQRPYDAPAARQLSMIGISPRVEVSVQTFQLLPHMVEGTSRVAMIQERLARRAVRAAPRYGFCPVPSRAVPVQEAMWWHPVHTQDAAHISAPPEGRGGGGDAHGAVTAPADSQPVGDAAAACSWLVAQFPAPLRWLLCPL
ncbi:LysR substrate-binding domain-containing protein [Streptomyces sp. L7]